MALVADMVAEKDNRCGGKLAVQQSFNNQQDGSQDFTKIMISSPRIETSFINRGSGSQNLKGLNIQCDDKSIRDSFEVVARFGMIKLFNYDENGLQTFSGFTFFKYLKSLASMIGERKIETQIPVSRNLPFSVTVQSFKNSVKGRQDFSHAKIESTAIGDSFNNHGSGSQTFRKAEIRCAEESSKPSRSLLPSERDRVAHYGTLHSFNNNGLKLN